MKNNDKIIIIFYVFLAISFTIGMLYIDSTFVTTSLPNIIPEPTTELEITQDFLGEREKIFSIMTNPENYPKVLSQNIKSVKIIEDFDNKILAEYEVVEAGITSKLLVQHRMSPYYEHTIEVIDGDAQGTQIRQKFGESIVNLYGSPDYPVWGPLTTINTIVVFDLKGILSPFGFLPKGNLEHAANTIVASFIDYGGRISESQAKKIDEIKQEFQYTIFNGTHDEASNVQLRLQNIIDELNLSSALVDPIDEETKKIDEIKQEQMPQFIEKEMKTLDELSNETKQIIDDLYREILLRPADQEAFEYWGSLLESGSMTVGEIRTEILNSDESLAYKRFDRKNTELVIQIFHEVYELNGPYYDIGTLFFDPRLDRSSDSQLRQLEDKYKYLLDVEEITLDEVRSELQQLKENGVDFFVNDLDSVDEQFSHWEADFLDEDNDFCYSCKYGGVFESRD